MFTGAIKLANIDDYITPSQQCIKPMMQKLEKKPVKINTEIVETPMKINNNKKDTKATITLNDCLACSGCITSAESILIQQMSITQFLNKSKSKECVFFISVQSRASIANFYKITHQQTMIALKIFFEKYFKISTIYDMQISLDICHALIIQEFHKKPKQQYPILCSECPGWVCYAQKVAPQPVIKHMSQVKSPQQIMGHLIKKNNEQKKLYVIGIMPCYDKKLEAIRFSYNEEQKQVDLVLSSQEIIDLIKMKQKCQCNQENCSCCKQSEKFPYLSSLKNIQFNLQDFMLKDPKYEKYIYNKLEYVADPKSNGYIHFLMNKLQIQQFKTKQIRNSDFIEYQFMLQGKIIKMAKCYGFRNIQNVVKMIKNNKCEYMYIQIMACPSGCFNGGGQIRIKQMKPKDLALALQKTIQQKNHKNQIVLQDEQRKIGKAQYKSIDKKIEGTLLNW